MLGDNRVRKGDEVIVTIIASDGKRRNQEATAIDHCQCLTILARGPSVDEWAEWFQVKAVDPDEDLLPIVSVVLRVA